MASWRRVTVLLVALAAAAASLLITRLGLTGTKRGVVYYLGRAEGCTLQQALNPINDRVRPRARSIREKAEPIETAEGLTLWRTPYGDWWAPDLESLGYVLAEQSLDTYSLRKQVLTSESVVIDAGANVGSFTRSALAAGAGLVVSIEPSPANVRALRRNFSEEIGDNRVIVVDKGLWHEPGVLPMYIYGSSALDSVVMSERVETKNRPTKVDVPLDTLDSIVQDLGLDRVDYVKMDIEGAERHAIRGARETIRRYFPNMVIAAENLPDDVSAVPEAVAAAASSYRMQTGDCRVIGRLQIRPEALHFFRPDSN